MNDIEALVEIINAFFGCDAAYYDVNPIDLATHLVENGVTVVGSHSAKYANYLPPKGE